MSHCVNVNVNTTIIMLICVYESKLSRGRVNRIVKTCGKQQKNLTLLIKK